MAANDFDQIGKVTSEYFHRVTGRVGDDLLL